MQRNRIQQLTRILSFSQYHRFPGHPFSSSPIELLSVGHVLRASRKFEDQDVARYAEVTGDYNPIHLDPEFAASVAGFERGRVVHGMLLASLFPSIIASHFPGAVYASQELKFKLPVYLGDDVAAQVQATNIKQMKNKYIVKFTTKCFTNKDRLMVDGEAVAILPTLCICLKQ